MEKDFPMVQDGPLATTDRVEVDIQISTAKQWPRDEDFALEKSIKHSTVSKKIASRCFYFRPVGKDMTGKMNFASGVSIQGAKNIYNNWGNIRLGAMSRGVVDGAVKVIGGCHDLESNVKVTREAVKSVLKRGGGLQGQNQIAVTELAQTSVAIRNAFLFILPDYVVEEYKKSVTEAIAGKTPDEIKKTWKQLAEPYAAIGCTEDDMRNILGVSKKTRIVSEDVVHLIGVLNAIRDTNLTIIDALGYDPKKKKVAPATEKPTPTTEKPAPKRKPPKKAMPKPQTPIPSKKRAAAPPEENNQLPPSQNVNQEFETHKLLLEDAVGEVEAKNFFRSYYPPKKFNALMKQWTDEQKVIVINDIKERLGLGDEEAQEGGADG